jgi:hypothetical protein
MKKYLPKIWKVSVVLLAVLGILTPHFAHAGIGSIIAAWSAGSINSILAYVGYLILTATASLVTAAGLFMSIAIKITLHIKDIYESIGGIRAVWITIRDISSMFMIFVLLYYSILTIVGQSDAKIKNIIVKIFLAGMFINFSLFFVRVGVDVSNIISLQFYNAIAPGSSQDFSLSSAYNDGGLSNVFIQSLQVQKVYSAATVGKGLDMGTSVFFATVGGMILMITAAFSLFAAAIAFTARTAILLFVMAVSPLYFAGMVYPQIEEKVSKKIFQLFKEQLLFMPIYLFLLYVALRVISDPSFNSIFNKPIPAGTAAAPFTYIWAGIIIQYTIAILFINAPLVAAIGITKTTKGFGMKWAPKADTITGFFGQHTIGRGARAVRESEAFKNLAAQAPMLGVMANKGLKKVSGATFLGSKGGFDERIKKYGKERAEFSKDLEYNDEQVKGAMSIYDQGVDFRAAGQSENDARLVSDRLALGREEEALSKIPTFGQAALSDRMEATKRIAEIKKRIQEGEEKGYGKAKTPKEIEEEKKAAKEARDKYEDDFKKSRQREFRTSMAEAPLQEFIFGKRLFNFRGRKEALKAIDKELKKGKKDKVLKDLSDIMNEDGEKPPKEDKGDKGGGEEKSGEKHE